MKQHEPAIRDQPWLTSEQWASLDDYRNSVPLLSRLVG